jgi:hypothetical protein
MVIAQRGLDRDNGQSTHSSVLTEPILLLQKSSRNIPIVENAVIIPKCSLLWVSNTRLLALLVPAISRIVLPRF